MIESGTLLQGRFLIEEQIGVGGMGAVYRAVDQKFGTNVAVKETFYRDVELAEAFEREARLLNGLHHPLFPHVSDHFTEAGGLFLVMEFIEGEDISAILKRGERFPFDTVMGWTLDLLDGLDYLHSQDPPIIHRDIKPSNLKLTSRGNIVLLDFGMAKETSGNTEGMRSVFGYSRRYSPLEQIEGTGTDVRSDIFSLGATVYHLLTGEPPVDVLRRASAIVAGRPDPIETASAVNPDVPARIAAAIDSALALNPDERFATAGAMLGAIEDALKDDHSAFSIAPVPVIVEDQADTFPALEAFEAGMEAGADVAPSHPGSVFLNVAEDDPIAAMVAQRMAQMKAADAGPVAEAPPHESARIEVPVMAASESFPDYVQELGVVDEERREREEIATIVPVPQPVPTATNRYNLPALLGLPLLFLILGIAGYALLRDAPAEEAVRETQDERITGPDTATQAAAPDAPAEEIFVPEEVVVPTERADSTQPRKPKLVEDELESAPVERRIEAPARERTPAYKPVAPAAERRVETVRDQQRNYVPTAGRINRATRPRIVDDGRPGRRPVSSIESIMTGIPTERPRRDPDFLEDREMRRMQREMRRNRRANRPF